MAIDQTELMPKMEMLHKMEVARKKALTSRRKALWAMCVSQKMDHAASEFDVDVRVDLLPRDEERILRDLEDYRVTLDRSIWHRVMTKTTIWSLMCSAEQERWYAGLEQSQVPEASVANVHATMLELAATSRARFKQMALSLFERLHPNYKSHDPMAFKKRMILQDVLGRYSGRGSRIERILSDLSLLLWVIDGKAPPAYEESLHGIFSKGLWRGDEEFSHAYLTLKAFANGNVHIWLEASMLGKLNAFVSNGTLGRGTST